MKKIENQDLADEDIMIFWSLEKLERYFKQDDKAERRRRQRFRIYTRKPQKRCSSTKTFAYEIN